MAEVFDEDEDVRLLRTIPGVGKILSVVIANEVGDVSRFPLSGSLSGICGDCPERTRIRRQAAIREGIVTNHYLKWAFAEAANTIMRSRHRLRFRHVVDLYERVCAKKDTR